MFSVVNTSTVNKYIYIYIHIYIYIYIFIYLFGALGCPRPGKSLAWGKAGPKLGISLAWGPSQGPKKMNIKYTRDIQRVSMWGRCLKSSMGVEVRSSPHEQSGDIGWEECGCILVLA